MPNTSSLYQRFIWFVAMFLLLLLWAGILSLKQWHDVARSRIDSTLADELHHAVSIIESDMEKFGQLSHIIKSRQPQLVELAYNDKDAAIEIVIKELGSFFEVDLILFFTEETLKVSNIKGLVKTIDHTFAKELSKLQITDKPAVFQLPDSIKPYLRTNTDIPQISYISQIALEDFSGFEAGRIVMLKLVNGNASLLSAFSRKAEAEVIITSIDSQIIMTTLTDNLVRLDLEGKQAQAGNKVYYLGSQIVNDLNGKELYRLAVAMDQAPFQAMMRKLLLTELPTYISLLLAALYLTWFLKRRIFQPINAQAKALQRVSEGDLKTRLTLLSETSQDEITRMGIGFNTMMDRLEQSYENLEEKSHQLSLAKQAAELAAKAKSQFLATMSHEIRTPMNGVLGMLHLLGKTELNSKQRRYVNTATGSGELLLTVLNDILDYSKLEAGKLVPESIPIDLIALVEQAMALLSKGAFEKGLEFDYLIERQTPRWVKGDPTRLLQVMTNLLSNSVKFTERGKILLSVNTTAGQQLHFSVRDTGIGMTSEQQASLFKAFSQVDSSHARKYGGTGLGLAISQKLITAMGGEITVQSQPEEGTEFNFVLPLIPVPDKQNLPSRNATLSKQRILIVDDSPSLLKMLGIILENWGIKNIGMAKNAHDALSQLHQAAETGEPYDIVITDMKMPEISGLELARIIRTDQQLLSTKLLMLSAVSTVETPSELDAWLNKPVQQSELYNTLLSLIGEQTSDQDKTAVRFWFGGRRLLLVEDNEVNQEVAKEILSETGFKIDLCSNGQDAIKAVQEQHYDIVLMDIQMPGMDGLQTTRLIRALGGRFTNLPIIAMTAHALAEDHEKSLAAGMNDHVTKPIDPDNLYMTITEWVKPGEPVITTRPDICKDSDNVTTDELPALPGINIEEGLKRLRGNQTAYKRLLLQFQKKQADVANQLESLIQQGDWQEATLIAHTLKGNSGNLGANSVYDAAALLEQACRQTDTTAALQQLSTLRANLAEVMTGLATLSEAPMSTTTNPSFNPEVVNAQLIELEHLLASDISAARECMDILLQQSAGSPLADAIQKLEDAMNIFDIDTAMAIAKQLQVA